VLTVVQDKQYLRWPETGDDFGGRVAITAQRYTQGSGNGCRHNLRVTDWRQVNEGCAISKCIADVSGNGKR